MDDTTKDQIADIVSAFVSNNTVRVDEIPALIATVYTGMNAIGQVAPEAEVEETKKPTPGQIRKSITDDGLISFVDGKSYKTLKRHLTGNGMTFPEYKDRYGLPKDYPSTAPAYSAARSEMAKKIGLGRKAGEKAGEKAPKKAAKVPSGKGPGRPRKDALAKDVKDVIG